MFCSLFLFGSIQYIVALSSGKLANVMEVLDWVFELMVCFDGRWLGWFGLILCSVHPKLFEKCAFC